MKKRTPVSKIMTSDVISVNVTQSIKEVSDLIEAHNIRHIPVVSGDKIVGLISSTDIEKISFVNTAEGEELTTAMFDYLTIEQVMSKQLTTLQQDDFIFDAAKIISENHFNALPVLADNKLVGIVTSTDLIKYLLEQY